MDEMWERGEDMYHLKATGGEILLFENLIKERSMTFEDYYLRE